MISEKQIKSNKKYKVFEYEYHGPRSFYYVDGNSADSEAVLLENNLNFAYSEWWGVFRGRTDRLKEAGISGIPIITLEECVGMGL